LTPLPWQNARTKAPNTSESVARFVDGLEQIEENASMAA